jgi:hypothetical protein
MRVAHGCIGFGCAAGPEGGWECGYADGIVRAQLGLGGPADCADFEWMWAAFWVRNHCDGGELMGKVGGKGPGSARARGLWAVFTYGRVGREDARGRRWQCPAGQR